MITIASMSAGDLSYYDQEGNRALDNYHQGHIIQIGKLYKITGEPALKEYSDRLVSYAGQGL